MKLRLYVSERSAEFHQEHQTLAIIISQAFGDNEEADASQAPQTKEQFMSVFSSVFGKGN